MTRANESAKPSHQPRGARRVSTMALIASVTETNVCPGAITGGPPLWGRADGVGSDVMSGQLGVRVSERRQIRGSRPRVQLGQQAVTERLGFPARDLAVRVVHVAKNNRLGRTGGLASREDVAVADGALLDLGLDLPG